MEESKQDCSDRDADSDRTSDIPLRECDCFRLEICAKHELLWNGSEDEGATLTNYQQKRISTEPFYRLSSTPLYSMNKLILPPYYFQAP